LFGTWPGPASIQHGWSMFRRLSFRRSEVTAAFP